MSQKFTPTPKIDLLANLCVEPAPLEAYTTPKIICDSNKILPKTFNVPIIELFDSSGMVASFLVYGNGSALWTSSLVGESGLDEGPDYLR